MCSLGENITRLIKSDMAVMSQSEKLQINAADFIYNIVMGFACLVSIRFLAVRHICMSFVDIDMVKKIVVHEIPVALVAVTGKASVLVQVYTCNCREVKITIFVAFNKLLICSHR